MATSFDDQTAEVQGVIALTLTAQLMDDPFRSLASALRRAGGFVKHPAPFSEFAWAMHLRRHIPLSLVEHHFDAALREALGLSSAPPRPAHFQAALRMARTMSPDVPI